MAIDLNIIHSRLIQPIINELFQLSLCYSHQLIPNNVMNNLNTWMAMKISSAVSQLLSPNYSRCVLFRFSIVPNYWRIVRLRSMCLEMFNSTCQKSIKLHSIKLPSQVNWWWSMQCDFILVFFLLSTEHTDTNWHISIHTLTHFDTHTRAHTHISTYTPLLFECSILFKKDFGID